MKINDILEGLKDPKDNPCWKGYHPVGTKKKNGKTVPNCVPEAANPAQQAAIAIAKKSHNESVNEFAPEEPEDRGKGDKPQFMTWEDFVSAVANQVKGEFAYKEKKKQRTQLSGKFIPLDSYSYGPVMVYAYRNPRSGRSGIKCNIQFGSYSEGSDGKVMSQYHIPKDPSMKMIDMTPANVRVVARIILSNASGSLKESLEETYEGDEFYETYGDLWYDEDGLYEAEYHGRKVPLGKPMQGDVKKFKVYVKDPKTGNVKKVNFGDPNMRIKKSNPKRRKSFRARHHCENPGPRTKARYWSCRAW
jgi:hypothetical protein